MPEKKESVEAAARTIRHVTRKKYSAEEKVRIVLEGLRGETSVAALCRREGIPSNQYYRWSRESLEAGKQRLVADAERQSDSRQVNEMRAELEQLKQLVAELSLRTACSRIKLAGRRRSAGSGTTTTTSGTTNRWATSPRRRSTSA